MFACVVRRDARHREVEAQKMLIRDRVQRHLLSSHSHIVETLDGLRKGTEMILHSQLLVAAE